MSQIIRCVTHSESDTLKLAHAIGEMLSIGDTVLLRGDLGTGKSVFARGIGKSLGVTGNMPSPTFTLMIPYCERVPLYHFDLYRLSDPDELYEAGLDEYIGSDGIAIIEWPEMADINPYPCLNVTMCVDEDTSTRMIDFVNNGISRFQPDMLNRWRENT
ncbi:MAG: tRNA (adenosine(37)-N6)-threonylcarbamoyltransferase complex ATPase subunit type 1 TsaE [Clostridia bacterium]|nr:tRNA (adenosine(37)-N6)-threonylcarbamoyltransferase complex ATPase subunit type 1 TsaE [Clostridia bacterium]